MAFHPYPQLIPSVFNLSGFGPPRGLTRASPWPWVDHSASGPEHTTTPPQRVDTPYSDSLSLRLPLHGLTSRHVPDSQAHSSKGTPSPHDKSRALTDCKRTVSGTISLPSRGTFHHSLTVLSAIGHQGVFSLTRWSWQIHRKLQEFAATREHPTQVQNFHLPGFHRLRLGIHSHSPNLHLYHCARGCQTPSGGPHDPGRATPDRYHTRPV